MDVVVYSKTRLFAEALAGWLSTQDHPRRARYSCRFENLLRRVDKRPPDIVLIDVRNEASLRDARTLHKRNPELRLLAVALPDVSEAITDYVEAGFLGFFPRDGSLENLVPVIEQTLTEGCAFGPDIAASMMRALRDRASEAHSSESPSLTKREKEILELLAEGLCNKAIARALSISVSTVKNHLHNIFSKLGVSNRVEAVALLHESPWLAMSA